MPQPNLKIFGSTAYTGENTHIIHVPDTLLLEDVFKAMADEPIDSDLLLTDINYQTINPILRKPMFVVKGAHPRCRSKYYY